MVNVYASWWYLLSDHNYINQCFFLTFLHHLPFFGDKLLLKLINCWRNISAGIVRFWWSLCYLSFSKGITKTECHRKTCSCSKRRVFKAMLLKPQFQEEFQMTRLFKLKKICAFFIRQGGSSCVALPPCSLSHHSCHYFYCCSEFPWNRCDQNICKTFFHSLSQSRTYNKRVVSLLCSASYRVLSFLSMRWSISFHRDHPVVVKLRIR